MDQDDYEFDSEDDELRDEEYPDEQDLNEDADGDLDLIPCSACGAEVYEDSVQCPVCGEYLTTTHNRFSNWPISLVVFGVIGMLVTIWVLLTAGR